MSLAVIFQEVCSLHKSFSDSNSSSPYSVSEASNLDVEKKKKDGKLEVEARKARGQVRRGWNRGRLALEAAWRSGAAERIFHFIWSRF